MNITLLTKHIYSYLLSVVFVALLLVSPLSCFSQKGILSVLEDKLKAGDDAYLIGNYALAFKYYSEVAKQDNRPKNINLRIARSSFLTHNYKEAVIQYEKYKKVENNLALVDQYYYAESLTSIGALELAKQAYTNYLEKDPTNTVVGGKIWRINNISYLYEDSLKNAVHYAELNSTYDELQMVAYEKGVILISNRPTVAFIKKIDQNRNVPFNHLFYTEVRDDPFSIGAYFYDELKEMGTNLPVKFHIGPISLYQKGKKMAYIANSSNPDNEGYYPLRLYFAEKVNHKWRKTKEFPITNLTASIQEVTVAESGDLLYFSAELENGFGGLDLYKSELIDGKWTVAQNLGPTINTTKDEVFPFLHSQDILYFSSNGHPGLGGLDIFKAKIQNSDFYDIENLGYPINSAYDDLAFSIDSLSRQGFLSSNRAKGGLDNDIYEVDMNLQAYPLEVEGVVKFIEHNWMDSTELEILPNVTLKLIDIASSKVVTTSKSNREGKFQFTVPYFSQYKIQIIGNGLDGIVSFEVPKYAKEDQIYEIVVVNDDFKEKKEN